MRTSTIGARLRAETLTAHASIEELVLATGFMSELGAYRRYLQRLYGFYVPFERNILTAPELCRWLPDASSRQKAALIEIDLIALGESPAAIAGLPCCAELTAPTSSAAALGAAYVVEGSTLGGRYILSRLDPVVPVTARRFFDGYGARTGESWRAFCDALAAHGAAVQESDDDVVDAANATFRTMERWVAGSSLPR